MAGADQHSNVTRHPVGMTGTEWRTRVDLAAAYRALAWCKLADLADGFISARIPDDRDAFLVYGYADFPETTRASRLYRRSLHEPAKVEKLAGPDYASVTMTQAVLKRRPDLQCVIHAHPQAIMVFAAMRTPLLPISQSGIMFHGERVGYLDFCYNVEEPGHCEALAETLSDRYVAVLRNHGVVITGRTIPQAFKHLYYFNQACAVQIEAMKTGGELVQLKEAEARHWSREYFEDSSTVDMDGTREWPALLELLERMDPSFKE